MNQWDPHRIKELRQRLGMSHADMARRLHIESFEVIHWELGQLAPVDAVAQDLDLLEIHAEVTAFEVSQLPLAEAMMDEIEEDQIPLDSVANRYKENN